MESKPMSHKKMFKSKVRAVILEGTGLPLPSHSNWDSSNHFFKDREPGALVRVIKRNRPTEFGKLMLRAAENPKEMSTQTRDSFPRLLPTSNGPQLRSADVLLEESRAMLSAVNEGIAEVGKPIPRWLGAIAADLSDLVALSLERRDALEVSHAAAWQRFMETNPDYFKHDGHEHGTAL